MFKVDFAKAYNSVSWEYLDYVTSKIEFSAKWRKWMMECVTLAKIAVLLNGNPTDEFGLGRGLRQDDPLSPFLFLIVAERLSVMMKQPVEKGMFKGYKIGETCLEITHLQYVDDTLLVGEATWENIWAIKCLL